MNQSDIIEETVFKLNSILSSAHEQFISEPNRFFSEDHISSLAQYISIVANLCNSLNLSGFEELKPYLESSSFASLRTRWDHFLSELDNQSLISSSNPSSVPSDLQVLDIHNNELINFDKIYNKHDRNLFVFLRHLA